ncbi:CBO0543 family protein [Cohnella hashimotonis]|uniref:CBO0543 family protein n=1 Tax=Cohnella hashimotonis TaxID=2826895 RepID=A0ABT6TD97_9BACL|nr:CBO0543 family protein [Cohnella hashimotonis]MDI4644744.1 CBO0543 family protein [Cohnella hashimotonis]
MKLEHWIETFVWMLSAALLYGFIPADKRREAALSIIFMQFIAWLLGLVVVELHWISYPQRIFTEATRANVTFEFCALPAIGAIFNVRYPAEKPFWHRTVYALAFPTVLAAVEWPIEIYTDLVRYEHWNLAATWISELAVLQACYRFYRWYFGSGDRARLDV